jgi:hypothetical protein
MKKSISVLLVMLCTAAVPLSARANGPLDGEGGSGTPQDNINNYINPQCLVNNIGNLGGGTGSCFNSSAYFKKILNIGGTEDPDSVAAQGAGSTGFMLGSSSLGQNLLTSGAIGSNFKFGDMFDSENYGLTISQNPLLDTVAQQVARDSGTSVEDAKRKIQEIQNAGTVSQLAAASNRAKAGEAVIAEKIFETSDPDFSSSLEALTELHQGQNLLRSGIASMIGQNLRIQSNVQVANEFEIQKQRQARSEENNERLMKVATKRVVDATDKAFIENVAPSGLILANQALPSATASPVPVRNSILD